MKRIITCIAILITAFAQTQAQHPRVCDYVSLKHALKNKEYEIIHAEYDDERNGVHYVNLQHKKEETRIYGLNSFGRDIDRLNLINYHNDTVYFYSESGFYDCNFIDIKSNKGIFRIYDNKKPEYSFKQLEINNHIEPEEDLYTHIFDWDGMDYFFKHYDISSTADYLCTLTRCIFKDYKLIQLDEWNFKQPELIKDTDVVKIDIMHEYDTISKKNHNDYFAIMSEDVNTMQEWIKKGSIFIYADYGETEELTLYNEPDKNSKVIQKLSPNDKLIIYDCVGFWYYVKVIDKKGKEHNGWVKLKKEPGCFYNAEFYK